MTSGANTIDHDFISATLPNRAIIGRGSRTTLSALVMMLAGAGLTAQAHAQATTTNLVSACSGVSLPRSIVTDILTPVVNGIVTPVQGAVNPILGTVGQLVGIPALSINAAGLLSQAAAGDPITLQVLNANGTVVAPTDRCDLQANSYGLDTQGGVAIGGNRITGLGTDGLDASAGEANSIAFGNSASTDATSANSIAFGTGARIGPAAAGGLAVGAGATVTAANSVALGTGSLAARGANTGYSATGLAAAQTSAGEVSVGAAGAERQITNVAAGSAPTDAVNVAQLFGVAARAGDVTDTAVLYDGADKTSVTLAGIGGTTITNLRAGTLSATSTDAVNGSQLYATNVNVANNTTAITNLIDGVAGGSVGPVQYSNPADPTVPNGGTRTNDLTLVGAAAAPVALHNVADGSLAAGSTDAVNGGQLNATNQAVTMAQTTATTALTLGQNSVQYDNADHTDVTLGSTATADSAAAPVAVHNVAAGTSPTDAVNVGQLDSGIGSAVSQANAYTDQRLSAISYDLRKVRKDSYAGTAGALAAAGLPQPYEAGKGMIAMAGGTYQGQSALAIGLSRAMNDGHTIVKLAGTYDTQGRTGGAAGVGYQF